MSRPDVVARSRAFADLAAAHPAEFRRILREHRRALGLPADPPGTTGYHFDPEEIATLWQSGKTIGEIASDLGCHYNTVRAYALRLGLEPRRRAG